MAIINSVLNWLVRKRMHQIEYFKAFPNEVQNDLFLHLMSYAEDTEWGLKYDYSSIKTTETFRERVPVSTYEDLMPIIERLKKGEQNLLWPGEVKWFAKSSGTSGSKSKFIPISRFTLEECHYKAGKDVLTLYLNNFPDSEVFYGKGLLMGGSQNIQEVNNSSYYEGDLSAILIHNMPYWSQILRTPSESIALMNEWESKLTLMAESTINHHVTSISGVPSWTLVLLNRILELSGKKNIAEVWPDLEVFFHGGVSFTPYRDQYMELIPKKNMNYFETYNASEGFFGIQDRPNASDMLLMLDYGIFYEFVKTEEIGKRFPRSYTLDEVETGVNYAMIISTNSGLWRYMIGDTVHFTSLKPFRIQVTGRTKNFINIVGEELMVDNAEKALSIAASKTNATLRDYTAAPLHQEGTIRHEWLIEFATPPVDFDQFEQVFDESLKSLNSDYEAKRYHDLVLKPPLIRALEEGSFYSWLKRNNKLGGQHKVPRLLNHRDIVDDILKNSKLATDNFKLKIQ